MAAIPFMNAVTELNSALDLPVWLDAVEQKIKLMEENAARLTELFLKSETYGQLAFNLLMIAVLPALGEEFLFRGVLQRLFTEWTKNKHVGILIGAFVFSFIHFQFYGFIPRFLLGLYFGYLLIWSSSIWVPVAAHFINNGVAVIYYHFASQPMGETPMDQLGISESGNYLLYLSFFITILFVGMIYQHEQKRSHPAA
jgi:membrane protease YdiL (CAAX protease family)